MAEERARGVVETVHLKPGDRGGSYGVILGDDGQRYVWSDGNWYRDGSRKEVGVRVVFTVVRWHYATEIMSPDMRMGRRTS